MTLTLTLTLALALALTLTITLTLTLTFLSLTLTFTTLARYVELNMVDGGSGKCVRTLAPEGVSERGQRALKSISCELGKP